MRRAAVAALLLLTAACDGDPTAPGAAGVPERYSVVPVGAPPAGHPALFSPVAINDLGQIALYEGYYGRAVALWSEGEYRVADLPIRGRAHGLNDAGRIVGCTEAPEPGTEMRPFVAESGRVWYLAGEGLERACALGINDAGTVVGMAGGPQRHRAFILSGAQVAFVEVPGDTASRAVAVNGRGEVAINSSRTRVDGLYVSRLDHASLWRDGRLLELGYLSWPAARPGQVADVREFSHTARDLNDRSEVVGDSWGMVCTDGGSSCFSRWRAFLWRDGEMVDLGKSVDAYNSSAVAINRWSHVLVRVHNPEGSRGYLWSEGKLTDLNEALAGTEWRLTDVHDLNDEGQVLARARQTGAAGDVVVRLDPA